MCLFKMLVLVFIWPSLILFSVGAEDLGPWSADAAQGSSYKGHWLDNQLHGETEYALLDGIAHNGVFERGMRLREPVVAAKQHHQTEYDDGDVYEGDANDVEFRHGHEKHDGWDRRLVVQSFEDENAQPNPKYVLGLTFLRAAIVLYIAPCFILYGPVVRVLMIFFQAAAASGLWLWWDTMTSVAYHADVPPLFEGFVKVAFGTVTVGYTMACIDEMDIFVKAYLLAFQVMDSFMPLVGELIHDWAGCTGMVTQAKALRGQDYDTWAGCPDPDKYYGGIWMLKGVEWGVIIVGGLVALKLKAYLNALSSSMFGAELLVAAVIQTINDVIAVAQSPEEAEEMRVMLLINKLIFTYAVFGFGMLIQSIVLKKWLAAKVKRMGGGDVDDQELQAKTVRCCFRWIVWIHCYAYPAMRLSNKKMTQKTPSENLVQVVPSHDEGMENSNMKNKKTKEAFAQDDATVVTPGKDHVKP